MTHQDAGHYALKHSPSLVPDARIARAVKGKMIDGKMTCAAAHKIAAELKVSPAEVGVAMDLMEIRISKCQLGLFGYEPQNRIVQPAETVSPFLRQAIETSLVEKRLPCRLAWAIAERFGLKKTDLANACEALKIKISNCQIGSFR